MKRRRTIRIENQSEERHQDILEYILTVIEQNRLGDSDPGGICATYFKRTNIKVIATVEDGLVDVLAVKHIRANS